jgi:dienelactone hydrolase
MKSIILRVAISSAIGGLLCILSSGCKALASHPCCATTKDNHPSGWFTNSFGDFANSTGMLVKVCKGPVESSSAKPANPPVLLLHELPGMTPQCLSLATNLAANHFTVYLPLMFGKVNTPGGKWDSFCHMMYLAFTPRWHAYRSHCTSPIAKELSILINDISRTNGNVSVGVIGMCLAGSLPLALLSNNAVHAVVLSQPAIPLIEETTNQEAALGLSDSDLSYARNRVASEHIPVLGLRFETDTVCRPARFQTLRANFGNNFSNVVIASNQYPADVRCLIERKGCQPHSVLATSYNNDAKTPTRVVFDEVVSYLHQQLK